MSRIGAFVDFLRRLWNLDGPGDPGFGGGTGIRAAWLHWQEMPYSGQASGMDTSSGVDLSGLNRRIEAIFRQYFEQADLDESAVDQLEQCEATLIQVVPSLTGDDRQYFAMALSITQWMLELQAGIEGEATT